VLKATATAVAGSPGNTFTLTLDTALPAGNYVLRTAANTVQDPNNTPNVAETDTFTLAAAAVQAPTITLVTGPTGGATTTASQPTWTGTAQAFQGRTIPAGGITASVDGGAFSAAGVTQTSGTGTANVSWSFTPTVPLSDAAHTVTFKVTDSGANTATTGPHNFVVNASPPAITSAVIDPVANTIRVVYNQAIDCNGTGGSSALTGAAFSYNDQSVANDDDGAGTAITTVDGTTCDVTFGDLTADDFGTLTYTQPALAASRVQDTSGTDAPSQSIAAQDVTAPTMTSVVAGAVGTNTVTVNMSEPIRCNDLGIDDFTVMVDGGARTVTATGSCTAATVDNQFTLTFDGLVLLPGQVVTVTAVPANTLRDESPNANNQTASTKADAV